MLTILCGIFFWKGCFAFIFLTQCTSHRKHVYLLKRYAGLLLDCHKKDLEGSTLFEERKEQLEQLSPPIKIMDPPFAIRWYPSSRSRNK